MHIKRVTFKLIGLIFCLPVNILLWFLMHAIEGEGGGGLKYEKGSPITERGWGISLKMGGLLLKKGPPIKEGGLLIKKGVSY